VVSAAQARGVGLSDDAIRARCRRGEWRELFRGVYLVDADTCVGCSPPRRTVIGAGMLVAGPHAVAVRQTAAELWGLGGLPADDSVHVAVRAPEMRRQQEGLRYHQLAVADDEVGIVDGLRATTVLRTVADLLLVLARLDAVSMLDSVLHARRLEPSDLAECLPLVAGRPGCVAARRHIVECDARAESPAETRVRLICSDGGLPAPTLQCPVTDDFGVILGYADLGWRPWRVAVEVDGADPHSRPDAVFRDRHRQNDFTAARWNTVRFSWADTFHPGYIVSTVRRALAAAPPHHDDHDSSVRNARACRAETP
jgi:hypothetical protein